MIKMSFYDGTLDREKLIEFITYVKNTRDFSHGMN